MKPKKQKLLIGFLICSLLFIYGSVPPIKTAGAVESITNAKDTLSSSIASAGNVTHTFKFETGSSTPQNGYWRISMPATFTGIAQGNVTCGYNGTLTASTTGSEIDCKAGVGGQAATSTQVIITGVTNPSTVSSYIITIGNYDDNNVLRERVEFQVAIVDLVYMTARVASALTFTVTGTTTTAVVNGVNCTGGNTTSTSTPFGTLASGVSKTVCQDLHVTTNANDGYSVTVEQNRELTSDSGSNINSFDNSPDNTGSSTPHAWANPMNTLDSYNTYGHMGLTSDDASLDSTLWSQAGTPSNPFNVGLGAAYYYGLTGTQPVQVMFHTGPSDGKAQNKGVAHVAYTAQIESLQEAGDYNSTLTYICTPTF